MHEISYIITLDKINYFILKYELNKKSIEIMQSKYILKELTQNKSMENTKGC